MKDFITEAWLRANHTLSEGAEIHLPADSRPVSYTHLTLPTN